MRTVDPVRYAERRARILDAAAEVFAERGFDGATTAAICRRAGIGSGTLFHYFPDKKSIFHALFADDSEATKAFLEQLDRSDPLAALFAVIDHRTADATHPVVPGLLMALLVQLGRDPELAAIVDRDEQMVNAVMADLIRKAARRGQVRPPTDPETAARWISALIDAVYLQAGRPGVDPAREVEVLRVVVTRFLDADPGARSRGRQRARR
ncbi:TetR/AcrR family transcriptional regulator [Thermasporomyces composti]|jgi:AcrR family transcriptional regulator|uniref:TetR family transcriptional regulator n=1 Tax=Thermasporomyces composti TaxID=696763 RepID=A0A3D9V403_THECX|nr:TetR/AcrR family transcriptional regulator [Thermasporomyces composti]REF36209.1 TetR family transcriptional regulator [Thermasporomyces composti]